MSKQQVCAHCLTSPIGVAALNDDVLCHPDEAIMDCYVLVTAYGHPTPCIPCRTRKLGLPPWP